jgi:hypothetical protein
MNLADLNEAYSFPSVDILNHPKHAARFRLPARNPRVQRCIVQRIRHGEQ